MILTDWTRRELVQARELINRLQSDEMAETAAAADPGAYSRVLDAVEKRLALLPEHRFRIYPRYGDPVRVKCTATGRYLALDLALVRSAMDNSLFLDAVDPSYEPPPAAILPSDAELDAARTVLTHLLPGAF